MIPPKFLTAPQFKALAILGDCDVGATEDALLALGVTQDALAALVEFRFAGAYVARFANPAGLKVTRYWITPLGMIRLGLG